MSDWLRMVIHVGARSHGSPGWRRDIPISGSLRTAQDAADRAGADYGTVDVYITVHSTTPEQWWRRLAGGAWEETHA